ALHARARALAVAQASLDRYLDRIGEIADEAARKRDDQNQRLAARLLLRMGEAIEQELEDLDRAAGLYARVESSGQHVALAWMAMARVAGARGDVAEQRRVLAGITELPAEQITADERREAHFALVELELGNPQWRDAGVASLARVIDEGGSFDRPKAVLRAAIAKAPEHAQL